MRNVAQQNMGIRYNTTFDVEGWGLFCSKFVHLLYKSVFAQDIGQVQTLKEIEDAYTGAKKKQLRRFWKTYYNVMGYTDLPRKLKTVTPASMYLDPQLEAVYDDWRERAVW